MGYLWRLLQETARPPQLVFGPRTTCGKVGVRLFGPRTVCGQFTVRFVIVNGRWFVLQFGWSKLQHSQSGRNNTATHGDGGAAGGGPVLAGIQRGRDCQIVSKVDWRPSRGRGVVSCVSLRMELGVSTKWTAKSNLRRILQRGSPAHLTRRRPSLT